MSGIKKMKKVYSLQDNWDLKNRGLIYPTEMDGTFSIPFFIEGNEDGELDNEYSMEIAKWPEKEKSVNIMSRSTLSLKQVKNRLYKIKYKDCVVHFKARRSKYRKNGKWHDMAYVGKFKGPQSPLWILSVDEKEEILYDQYHIILIGHIEGENKESKKG